MSTPTTDGPSESNPSLAERIMNPDGGDAGAGDAGEKRSQKTFGRLRRHERTPRADTAGTDVADSGDTGSAGATAGGRDDRDVSDATTNDFADDTRDNNSGDDVRDTTDLPDDSREVGRDDRDVREDAYADDQDTEIRETDHGDTTPGGYDADDETMVQPAVSDRDDTPGGYDRPRGDSDLESTQAMPAYEDDDTSGTGAGLAGGAAAGGAAGLAGGAAASKRRVTRDELYAREDRQGERDRLERARAEHGATSESDTATDQKPVPATTDRNRKQRKVKPPRTTDKFFGALGLFLLRVITGVVMGVHGVQKLLNMDATAQFFSQLEFFGTPLPQAGLLAIITGAAEALIGVSLIFGFLTRLSGLGVLLISLGALLMVKMTSLPNPFAGGESGFDGELELILAAVGLLFLLVGGGGWGLDRVFRRKPRTDAFDDEL